jgi:hypothetical protein
MKSQDMLLELQEISRSLQHARKYIQSGMGSQTPFLKEESNRLIQVVAELEKDYEQYKQQHPVVVDTLKT